MHRHCGLLMVAVCAVLLSAAPLQHAALDVPKDIEVPTGCKLLFTLEGHGVQVYKAAANQSGQLEWVFEAPIAQLTDGKSSKQEHDEAESLGYHYEGPSWEGLDGSKVMRDKDVPVKSAASPHPDRDIPWLLIKVKAEEGATGQFSPVAYVQRINTHGGKAPSRAPSRAGTKVAVPYSAVYGFYGKAE